MAKPTEYTIHLIRVGETTWDQDQRIIGQSDLPMTQAGAESVTQAVRAFEPQAPVSMVLTSCEESAMWVANLFVTAPDIKLKNIDSLANVGMGLWEGVLHSGLEDKSPSAYNQWREAPERITPPEGESFFDAQDRLIPAIIKAISKVKGDRPGVALVLRPWAWAIARCWLNDEKIGDLWSQLDQPVEVESFRVTKSQLDVYQRRARASA